MKSKEQRTFLSITFIMILTFLAVSTSFAAGSTLDETPIPGRPPSAFSICCCNKLDENTEQINYACNLHEEACPKGSKKYAVLPYQCPGNLLITKQ